MAIRAGFVLGLALSLLTPAFAVELGDTFDRSNSSTVGYSEIVHGGRWIEGGERIDESTPANDDVIWQIVSNELKVNYATGYSQNVCTVGGFTYANVDMTVKCKASSDYYGEFYGLSYRLPNQHSVYQDSGGYYVRLNRTPAQDKIYLYYGATEVANANVTIPTSGFGTLRAEVNGTSHKIYFEGSLVINTTHNGNTAAGYIGVWGYWAIAYFDDFEAFDITMHDRVSDDFNRSDSVIVGAMKVGGKWLWSETGEDGSSSKAQIIGKSLFIDYSATYSNVACDTYPFTAVDTDISALCKPDSAYYGEFYGISYRLSNANNKFQDSSGYYARLNQYSSPNQVYLYYNTTLLAQANVTIPVGQWSRLRCVAQGTSHKVYLYPGSSDNFDRANSNNVGSIDGYTWTEVESGATDVKILTNQVRFTYNASKPYLAANIADYLGADMDITASVTTGSGSTNGLYGISYRMNTASDSYPTEGYYAYIDGGGDKVYLRFGTGLVASANYTVNDNTTYTMRVAAYGGRHRVYINGTVVLDVFDAGKNAPGYCGIFAGYGTGDFNDFSVVGRDTDSSGYTLDPAIDITDSSRTAAGFAGLWGFWAKVSFDDLMIDLVPSVKPRGSAFPLALYSCNSPADMDKERRFGWNMAHSYGTTDKDRQNQLYASRRGSLAAWMSLPKDYALNSTTASAIINKVEDESALGWWDLPEELTNSGSDWTLFTNWCSWINSYDRWQRARYMYDSAEKLDSHLDDFAAYEDITPASCYTTYTDMPHAWVKWRTVESVNGSLGDPVLGIVEMFYEDVPGAPTALVMTPEGAYHDFWQTIASGAKSIAVFSYAHMADKKGYKRNWDMYCRAASELTGPQNLDDVILSGVVQSDPSISYNSGTTQTPSFVPHGTSEPTQQYGSVDLLRINYGGDCYLITVSSATGSCNATISGLAQPGSNTAEVLFEGRTVSVTSGSLTDSWSALGVHIYKFDL